MALFGGLLFAMAPLSTLTRVVGVFLILIVVWYDAAPLIWIGLAVAAVFLAAAVRLRRYRGPSDRMHT